MNTIWRNKATDSQAIPLLKLSIYNIARVFGKIFHTRDISLKQEHIVSHIVQWMEISSVNIKLQCPYLERQCHR